MNVKIFPNGYFPYTYHLAKNNIYDSFFLSICMANRSFAYVS